MKEGVDLFWFDKNLNNCLRKKILILKKKNKNLKF
jgi:hypothetical protein